jgi:hypothetical protein
MADDYRYDVFFSYRRQELTLAWTRDVSQRLKLWLTEELGGRQAEMFIDETCIEVGDKWPDAIKDALKHSRCMICVWSPSYFRSSWCVSEWKSFLKRERILKIEAHGLIAPLKFHDGEHFPQKAQLAQWLDVAPYATTVPAFWNSPNAIELETKLKTFAVSVAKIIGRAPRFRPDWPIVESSGLKAPKIGLAKL